MTRLSWISNSRTLALLTALWPWAVLAQFSPELTPTGLPGTDPARAALSQDPAVLRARQGLAAAEHEAAMLSASPYEWTARVSGQRRSTDGGALSREWSAQIERPIRINGKAALDQELGDIGRALAQTQLGEARHEAARDLASLWLDWQAAHSAAEIAREQVGVSQANLAAVQSRLKAGDASRMDHNVARADLAETQRQLHVAEGTLAKARSHLSLRFPGLTLTAQALPDPTPLAQEATAWRDRILAESEPLRAAELLVQQAELLARRAQADRLADPTVGLYTASEAAGRERVVGVSLSLPLGSTYRSQAAQRAWREVDMARAALEGVRRAQELSLTDAWADATQGLERWRLAEASASAARENARLGQRGYALGEGDLQNLLLLRRQSLETTQSALAARVDAWRAQHRLMIDAHLIWRLADETSDR
jgi:cobalt-zinc-cadmium efflux system outer membrane protein